MRDLLAGYPGDRARLLEIYLEDQILAKRPLEPLEVLLDEAQEKGPSWQPSRLSWCDKVGIDAHGIFATLSLTSATISLRYIPKGQFEMGSPPLERGRLPHEATPFKVDIQHPFWMLESPCSQELWMDVMANNPSGLRSARCPVETVNWYDCQGFIRALDTQKPGLNPRLPDEAEWEYACRAGHRGARYGPLDEIAWYRRNLPAGPCEVMQKLPNAWGLYDMLGLVWEWCEDPWSSQGSPAMHGTNPWRVIRGGAGDYDAHAIRAASRDGWPPETRYLNLGFRFCVQPSARLDEGVR